MDKALEQNPIQSKQARSPLWDCGSLLYDSFELKSFERQLDSAIVSRTTPLLSGKEMARSLSMPRLSNPQPPPLVSKRSSKIFRSIHKFLHSVFRSKPTSASVFQAAKRSKDGFYAFYEPPSVALPTIPEVPEISMDNIRVSPGFYSVLRRTASERFTTTSLGISCA